MSQQPVIVVPWDFSEFSAKALEFAVEKFPQANLHVICVLEKPNPYASDMAWGVEYEARAIQKSIETFNQSTNISLGTHYHFTTLFGEPASEIARLTNELDANYIIMSTHGRTELKKWMLGSVAQRVTERAKCPVILLPSTWIESQSDSINSMAVAI